MPVHYLHKSLSESASLGSHFRENLQQTYFSVVLPASGLISLQQSLIESSKLHFMMKQHFDFLSTKSELATANNNWISPFLYNRVQSFSVGCTTIHTRDLKHTNFFKHTFPATYHLAVLMVCTFHSSLDMRDAAHTMMISDIATSAWLIDFCHKAI